MVRAIDVSQRTIGVNFRRGKADILLWAPMVDQVRLKIQELVLHIDLVREPYGYWSLQTDLLQPGHQYWFELTKDDEIVYRPDPASLKQPRGVHGPSAAVDLAQFSFTDQEWLGIPISSYIIYELHVGTFTTAGDLSAIINKLDHLLELGITAIEIMPVATFPGERNWGYDGVFPFSVQSGYGGPLALQKLVDACHQKGLSVILDVVYNHLGPEGNYFEDYGPYFTTKYQTPWGKAINFDDAYSDGVRHFFMENALMWLRDFHVDALRLDAVHAIKDLSAQHVLTELSQQVQLLNKRQAQQHYLIIECDLNDPKFIAPIEDNGFGMDAQWTDEFHHALRVAAGQERSGYYADFNGLSHLAKAYCDAYVYDGGYSEERKKTFGKKATGHPGSQFVVFSQNHDQIGNRMLGERSGTLYSQSMQKLLLGAVMVSPFVPLLFMGEEWGETNPFLYFVDHSDPDLIEAIRKGRAEEFAAFQFSGTIPDPADEVTFLQSKLQWELLQQQQHEQVFRFYKDMIHFRKSNPVLQSLERHQLKVEELTEQNVLLLYRWQGGHKILCFLNFSRDLAEVQFSDHRHWQLSLDSADPQYGGKNVSRIKAADEDILLLQPESILICTNHHV